MASGPSTHSARRAAARRTAIRRYRGSFETRRVLDRAGGGIAGADRGRGAGLRACGYRYLFINTFSYYLKIFPTLFLTDNQTPRKTKRDSYVRSHRFDDSWERRRFDRPDTGRRQHRIAPSLHGAAGPKPVFPVAVAVVRRWCRGPLRRLSLRKTRYGSRIAERNRKRRRTQDGRELHRFKEAGRCSACVLGYITCHRLIIQHEPHVENFLGVVCLG